VTVTRRVVLPVRFAREETGPFNRGGADGSLTTPSAPYLRGNRHRCHVGFALGKVFAVKFNGLVFDRLGGGVNGRFLFLFVDWKEQGGGLSKARMEPHVARLRPTSNESPRGKGKNLHFWALWWSQAAPGAGLFQKMNKVTVL